MSQPSPRPRFGMPTRPTPVHRLILVVLATTLTLTWPALLLNGAPLIFSDTMDYLAMSLGPERQFRARGYGWLAAPLARGSGSLWPVVVIQALLIAAVAHTALRAALPRLGAGAHLSAGLALASLTTAPWEASYIMPDALTAPGLLALYLALVLPEHRHGAVAVAAGVVSLAAASHLTHLFAALATLAALAMWQFLPGATPVQPRRLALAAAAALFGAGAAVGTNAALTGRAEYAGGGTVFLAARLAGDGLLQHHLARKCPDPALPRLCALRQELPRDVDEFLWAPHSLLYNGSDFLFFAHEPEMAAAAAATLRAYWPAWAVRALGRIPRQFVTLGAGDGLDRQLVLDFTPTLADLVSPAASAAALASRQAREELGTHPLAAVPGPLALAALTACAVIAVGRGRHLVRHHPRAALLLAVVLLGALANAGAVAFGGAVHARYQARLAWLFPLAAGVAWAASRTDAGVVAPRRATILPR